MFEVRILEVSATALAAHGLWLTEAVATLGLVLTILGALRWKPEAIPAAIGLYIVSAYWFTASTSFANPAVTIARSLTDTFSGIEPGGGKKDPGGVAFTLSLATVTFRARMIKASGCSVITTTRRKRGDGSSFPDCF
jgi:hypothetical protein